MNNIWLGDCLTELDKVQDESAQLLMMSPPYADSRKASYGGIHPDNYVDWFCQGPSSSIVF